MGYERPPRPDDDNYPTPDWATEALVSNIGPYLVPSGAAIWEPACGQGYMADTLKRLGYSVTPTTLVDYKYGQTGVNFLSESKLRAPIVITNPPYKLAEPFVAHALGLGADVVAMFLRAQFLGGAKRSKWLRTTPLAHVIYLTSRVTMYPHGVRPEGGGTATHDSIWMVWRKGYAMSPTLTFADRP